LLHTTLRFLASDNCSPVTGQAAKGRPSRDQRAISASAQAFIAEINPAGGWKVGLEDKYPQSQILESTTLPPSARKMRVTLTARSARDGQLLARSVCTVDSWATVLKNRVQVNGDATFAGLKPSDIRMVASVR